ncbi:butyrophilin-like protein 2 [Macrotis lagotis]|uniref:butyrophilin-like protein 2 n=1 Tax=Macrotis lagotis TaxID=92651 RepID=UPI003D69E247
MPRRSLKSRRLQNRRSEPPRSLNGGGNNTSPKLRRGTFQLNSARKGARRHSQSRGREPWPPHSLTILEWSANSQVPETVAQKPWSLAQSVPPSWKPSPPLLSAMIWTIKQDYWSFCYIKHSFPLYLIFLIFRSPASGVFTVSGPLVQPILALAGEDVLLSCHLSPNMDALRMNVKWVRGPLVVSLYRWGQERKDVQAPLFQGRTKMLRQYMAEGKVTVIIHQVRLSDSGQYTCYFQAGTFHNETSFDLQVAEPQKGAFSVTGPVRPIQAKEGEDVILSCELSPKIDVQNMTVKWFRNQTLVHRFPNGEKLEESQETVFQRRMELQTHDMTEGKVTLRIQQVQVSDSGSYTCYVRSPENYDEAYIRLWVAGNFSTSQKTHIITIAAVFLVVLGLLVTFLLCRKRKNQRSIIDSA